MNKFRVLLVYKDVDDFEYLIKCITNRFGKIIRIHKYDYIETECVEFKCMNINYNYQSLRGGKYDYVYISNQAQELVSDEFKFYCECTTYRLEMYGFLCGNIE